MDIDIIDFALEMLDEIRENNGCNSLVYNECVEFFQSIYNYNKIGQYEFVLFNPVTKKHELVRGEF